MIIALLVAAALSCHDAGDVAHGDTPRCYDQLRNGGLKCPDGRWMPSAAYCGIVRGDHAAFDAHGFLIAGPEAKRMVRRECPSANPLYVEAHGKCP